MKTPTPPPCHDVDRLRDQIAKTPGDWQVRLVLADALEEAGAEAGAIWQRKIATACRDMDEKAAAWLEQLRLDAKPYQFMDRVAGTDAYAHMCRSDNRPRTGSSVGKTLSGICLRHIPQARKNVLRTAARSGAATNFAAPQEWMSFQSSMRNGSLDHVPLFHETIRLAWPEIAEWIRQDDAAHLAAYEEARAAIAASE